MAQNVDTHGTAARARQARSGAERIARTPQFEWLARAGLVARGVVYLVIGVLAIKLALGDGGETTNQQGALKTIAEQSFGEVLLVIVAIGLAGYALWRLARAAIGHGKEDSDDTKDRVRALFSGLAYGALFVTAVKILISGSSGGGNPDKTAGGVLDWPAGPVLVVIVGLVIVGVGLDQGRKGIMRKFLEDSKTGEMSHRVRQAFTALGVFGHLARMVIFALIGYFLIKAAIDYNPDQAVSLDGALAKLQDASYGAVLLGIVAAGLIGFGAYSMADARYRKI